MLLQAQPNPSAAAHLHASILLTPFYFELDPTSLHFTLVHLHYDPSVALSVKTLQDLEICGVHQGFCVSKCFSGTMVHDSMRLHSQLRKR
jgi:hypothetical protein